MRLAIFLVLSCAAAFAATGADRELQLKAIYNQHAATSVSFGDPIKAAAENACADIHATAAERILANPASSRANAKWATDTCVELLKMAQDKKSEIARTSLIESCLKLKASTFAVIDSPSITNSCAGVGIVLDDLAVTPKEAAALTTECKPYLGQAFSEWPEKCAAVSSGLREYLSVRKKEAMAHN